MKNLVRNQVHADGEESTVQFLVVLYIPHERKMTSQAEIPNDNSKHWAALSRAVSAGYMCMSGLEDVPVEVVGPQLIASKSAVL